MTRTAFFSNLVSRFTSWGGDTTAVTGWPGWLVCLFRGFVDSLLPSRTRAEANLAPDKSTVFLARRILPPKAAAAKERLQHKHTRP